MLEAMKLQGMQGRSQTEMVTKARDRRRGVRHAPPNIFEIQTLGNEISIVSLCPSEANNVQVSAYDLYICIDNYNALITA
jgi:hypothetical protein